MRNQQQTQSTHGTVFAFKPGPHNLVRRECSHHCTIPAALTKLQSNNETMEMNTCVEIQMKIGSQQGISGNSRKTPHQYCTLVTLHTFSGSTILYNT